MYGNNGGQVDNFYSAGSCCLCPMDSVFPAIAFDGRQTIGDTLRSWIVDPMQMYPSYLSLPLFNNDGTYDPKIALDRNMLYQFIDYAYYPAGFPLTIGLLYCRTEYDTISHSWMFAPQQLVDTVATLAGDITASRHSDRVAIAYCAPRATIYGETNNYNNDIYLFISEDGVTWDFENPINVTDFIYPDTLSQDPGDTLRAYTDASVLFDVNNNAHVAFTTIYYNEINQIVSAGNSMIWHWSETTNNYGLIAEGWFEPVSFVCGEYQRFVQRPCLAIDENTNDLYVTYQMYDSADISANLYPQGEVMVSWSGDSGEHWAVGTDVSNTHVPGAIPPNCLSERDITCNQTILNDTLYLLYILDLDAGTALFGESSWTLNPVICQRIAMEDISRSPLLPAYPLHLDSTGFPPESPVIDIDHQSAVPEGFQLCQNFPNPFNPTTNISFTIGRRDHIKLVIYNITGQKITDLVDGSLNPGTYTVKFDAKTLSSGIYFYRLSSSTDVKTRKMLLIK